jgi:predicted amidohydrolase
VNETARPRLTVALVHQVFHGPDGPERLGRTLEACRRDGAELALLPELPLDRWAPATRDVREADAEDPDGPRHRQLAEAARQSGLAVLGGAITRDAASGRRFNRALLFDASGALAAVYDKLHLPCEEGFWESDHYEPGETPPRRIDALGFALGLQVCSDLNRPQGSLLLAAQGVEAILAPRCTPPESYARWRDVIRGNAITCATYVLSTNRSVSESGVSIGGPSLAVGPDGSVLLETTDASGLVTLDRDLIERARAEYPGYLGIRADLYARGWAEVSSHESSDDSSDESRREPSDESSDGSGDGD